jgi:hypothetical protein
MSRTWIAVLTVVAAIAFVVLFVRGNGEPDRSSAAPAATAVATVPSPAASSAEINKQDRWTKKEAREHLEAYERRPLLQQLPYVDDGISIDIAGLAADNETTILTVATPGATGAEARARYRQVLRRFGDSGRAYEPRYER